MRCEICGVSTSVMCCVSHGRFVCEFHFHLLDENPDLNAPCDVDWAMLDRWDPEQIVKLADSIAFVRLRSWIAELS